MPASLPKLLTVVAALAVIGGGVAAAEIGAGDEPGVSDVTTTTEVTAPPSTVPDDPDGEDPDTTEVDGVERYWGEECGEGPAGNHGSHVSGADRDGESRREAAHSPCGKPAHTVGELEPSDEDDSDESEPIVSSERGNGGRRPVGAGGPSPGKGGPEHG